ncbi:hypothetical protein ISF_02607 [Cordyceps fumosorosea ARSEF 2679]|uniref:Uncharacterized protein n=1 Tax=Cordyceps fumosorosea (strain ARSEF 2679) TaxID=1081104 RepID=A0A168BWD6_CORFA|nr:hypothetical protein ISF_02607 [Cordyceps fumosorosea ARSEF 2679]OAA70633.1 hypothetical protein ISF_02607 [Cordyceps fumosorosea ARSEF 2679]
MLAPGPPHHRIRLILGIIAIVALLAYSTPAFKIRLAEMASSAAVTADPIPQLAVTLAQVPGAHPPTLRATITNNNPFAVCLLDYDSPVDALAIALGLVELTPSSPADAAPVQPVDPIRPNRPWPPKVDYLVEVPGGGGAVVSEDIALRAAYVPYGELGARFFARMRGPWRAVVAMRKSEITEEFLERIPERPNTYQGTYESDRIEITVDSAAAELK